jgi:hypothetical protein
VRSLPAWWAEAVLSSLTIATREPSISIEEVLSLLFPNL